MIDWLSKHPVIIIQSNVNVLLFWDREAEPTSKTIVVFLHLSLFCGKPTFEVRLPSLVEST